MIRQGKLCRECSSTKCKEIGTPTEPNEIECPNCDSKGCKECNNGYFTVDGCPNKFCSDMAYVTQFVDLFQKGLPPISGGTLDQTKWFLDVAEQLTNDEAALKRKAVI